MWENIRKDPARLPENFSKAMKSLAENNAELRNVFENVDFVQFTNNRENAEILRQLVELFSARPLHHVSPDILGDAYEWILRYFAPQKVKEGEVYTAREVIKLIVEILDPKFKDESGIQKHDIVIANPPWNQDGYNEDILKKGDFWKERFRYGFTPRQSADWAWILHMVSSGKDDTGRIGVVIDNGCLFRGGKEKAIRTGIVYADLPGDEGSFRNRQVYVVNRATNEIIFTPPPTEEVSQLADNYLAWFNSNNMNEIDPVIASGITHYELV